METNGTIDNRIIHILDRKTGQASQLQPKAVESCMKPGTFHITPIEVRESDTCVEFCIGDTRVVVQKEALKNGEILVEELPFVPEVVRPKHSCNPCRNCGRC